MTISKSTRKLVTLRADLVRALPRAADRSTQVHIQGAIARIDQVLDAD